MRLVGLGLIKDSVGLSDQMKRLATSEDYIVTNKFL